MSSQSHSRVPKRRRNREPLSQSVSWQEEQQHQTKKRMEKDEGRKLGKFLLSSSCSAPYSAVYFAAKDFELDGKWLARLLSSVQFSLFHCLSLSALLLRLAFLPPKRRQKRRIDLVYCFFLSIFSNSALSISSVCLWVCVCLFPSSFCPLSICSTFAYFFFPSSHSSPWFVTLSSSFSAAAAS